MREFKWGVGDTLSAFAVTLKNNGTIVNLTGKHVRFYMEDEDGVQVVAETNTGVTITNAVGGEVDYAFQADDVANSGTFYAYFRVYNADPSVDATAKRDTYQPEGIKLVIGDLGKDRSTDAEIDIRTAANNPKRIRTDEGTVEERTIDDLIKADRYLKTQEAAPTSPFGLRVARTKPPGTV